MTKLFEPSENNDKNISTGYPFYIKYGSSYFAILGLGKTIEVNASIHTTSIRYITLSYPLTVPYTIISKQEFHEKLEEVKNLLNRKFELLQLAEAPRVDTTKEDDMIAEAIIEQESYDKVEREDY